MVSGLRMKLRRIQSPAIMMGFRDAKDASNLASNRVLVLSQKCLGKLLIGRAGLGHSEN
jgi:hypothetical protein